MVYEKTYPLQTIQGLQFGMSQGQVNHWIHRLTPILQAALANLGTTPERDGQALADSKLANEGGADLIIDGTERRRHRPKARKQQTDHYSGKKKTHTDKNSVVVNRQTKRVADLSSSRPGKIHDKKLADESAIAYPKNTHLGQDTGFQGYCPAHVLSYQPKKIRGRALTEAERFYNRMLSSARSTVEHVLSGVKRLRIVNAVLRNSKVGFSDRIMEIACALHNWRIDFRQPAPSLNLLDLAQSYSQ